VDLSVCGEMAGDPMMVALLVGLGFRSFSMTPAAIPILKRALAALDSQEAAVMARRARQAHTADMARAIVEPLAAAMHRAALTDPVS
jgi:phosphotransferase system enzyme I (PtsI)